MNKHVFRLAGCILLTALLLGLCGCKQSLEQARSARAVYTDNGDIVYNGQTYLHIFQEKLNQYYYNPESGLYEYPDLHSKNELYVTQPDVPLLLSKNIGDRVTFSDDGIYLRRHIPAPLLGAPEDRYYCRADIYDQCLPSLSQDDTRCFYEYQTYNPQQHMMNKEYVRYFLTQQQLATVEQVLSTVEPVEEVAFAGLDAFYFFHLYRMQDGHLRYWISVIASDSGHLLAKTYDGTNVQTTYAVPPELETAFCAITQAGTKELTAYDNSLDEYFNNLDLF